MQPFAKKFSRAALAVVYSTLALAVVVPAAHATGSYEDNPGLRKNDRFANKLSNAKLLSALRSGGYVVFIRHGQTEKDNADQAQKTMRVNDCSTQRTLSEKGWNQSKTIGMAFKKGRIPVGKVISSQYCRAWQTADLAFGNFKRDARLNFAPAEEYTDAQVASMKAGIMPHLTTKPAAGTNTVVVGHDDVFESATGIYPAPQGIAYVVKPMGNGFELLAKLSPQDWKNLVK